MKIVGRRKLDMTKRKQMKEKPYALTLPVTLAWSLSSNARQQLHKNLLEWFNRDKHLSGETTPAIILAQVLSGVERANGKENSLYIVAGWKRDSPTLDILKYVLYEPDKCPDEVLDAINDLSKDKNLVHKYTEYGEGNKGQSEQHYGC